MYSTVLKLFMNPQNTGKVSTAANREIPLHIEAPINSSSKTTLTLRLKVAATAALLVSPFIIPENKWPDASADIWWKYPNLGKFSDAANQRANTDRTIKTKDFTILDPEMNNPAQTPKKRENYREF